jgi:hypothetical protein
MSNLDDQAYVAQIANFIFDDQLTASQITPAISDVAASAFLAAVEASRALDKVPRPTGFRPGVVWLLNQAVQSFWRSSGRQSIYDMARVTAKVKWRSAYEMAKQGI